MNYSAPRPADGRQHDVATLYRLTDRLYRAQKPEDVYSAALDEITYALGCARASILLFDDSGVMRFVSWRGLSDLYRTTLNGHTPWSRGERNPKPILVSDIEEMSEPELVKSAIRAEGIRALAFVPLVVGGGTVGKFMTYYDHPRLLTDHEVELAITIARQVGFCIERLESERARESMERELRESEERFRLMCEHAPVMIWMSDANGKCLHLNKLLRDFWGVEEGQIDTFDWASTMHSEDELRITDAMTAASADRSPVTVSGKYRSAQGNYRILQTNARPRFADGRFVGMIGVNYDVTEREEAEENRRKSEAHRELLIAELNHRVRNTLSVVQAIARQTFKGTASDACAVFNARLSALARSHDLLTKSHWDDISLENLAAACLQLNEGGGHRVFVQGPPVLLKAREAVGLGMALHELFTNALKYGALSNTEGTIFLSWLTEIEPKPALRITWREQDGPLVAPPGRAGFGSHMLERTLKGDLNADVSLDYQPAGLVCSISICRRA